MKQQHAYIVTVTAGDRVGIVHAVTGTLKDEGGNILELSQTVMRGFFTIILEVVFDRARDEKALARLIAESGSRYDMTVAVLAVRDEGPEPAVSDGERFILTVLGGDAPGNIHGIAGCLASRGVNIVDLHARSDGPRFSLVMEAFLPSSLSPAMLRGVLETYGREHGLEAFVQHENIFQATSEPSPVRVGQAVRIEGDAVVPH